VKLWFCPQQVGSPHTKHLRGDLWEIRLTGAGASARTICVTVAGQTIVVVHVFFKKTQKTPKHALTLLYGLSGQLKLFFCTSVDGMDVKLL